MYSGGKVKAADSKFFVSSTDCWKDGLSSRARLENGTIPKALGEGHI
jgi:hypothetical protein